jgi:hypothetical protein
MMRTTAAYTIAAKGHDIQRRIRMKTPPSLRYRLHSPLCGAAQLDLYTVTMLRLQLGLR